MRKILVVITACCMLVSLVTGCGSKSSSALEDELFPVSSIAMSEEEVCLGTEGVPVKLYFANEDNTQLKMEIRYIPMSEAKKSINSLASSIVKELIKGPQTDSGLKATIPAGVELRSPIAINAGVAVVDFNKQMVENHTGGKEAEKMTIYSIVNSLTEITEIQKVKFNIEGKAKENFKGNFKFDAPFPRTMSMVSKEVPSKESEKKGTDPNATGTQDGTDVKKDSGTDRNTKETIEEIEDTMNEMDIGLEEVIEILE